MSGRLFSVISIPGPSIDMNSNSSRNFSIRKRLESFLYAFRGIGLLIRSEHNARIHFAALILVIIAGVWFKIEKLDWIIIVLVSAFVFSSEAINSAIESLADEVSEEKRERIRNAKDLAAGAVLIAAISATVAGIYIFLPDVLALFGIEL